jgi:hypothetical protein
VLVANRFGIRDASIIVGGVGSKIQLILFPPSIHPCDERQINENELKLFDLATLRYENDVVPEPVCFILKLLA